ncbi:hypothetical protein AC578_8335 [Pseudocercospora eumusae]|uniref:Cyclochlorotine biosynthesis protein O n=1 Tax=Pseudocercospora eumusae TaxID=321146 RepID=A0A139GWE4_9PEZI|nr:hypothetical protein AC578_8335 [Pseudocercospora eumusae]
MHGGYHKVLPYDSLDGNDVARKTSSGRKAVSIVISSFVTSLFWMALILQMKVHDYMIDDKSCVRQLNTWSPLLDQVEYYDVMLDLKFLEKNSLYRGVPTPEKDAAWRELWDHGHIGIPRWELYRLNKSIEFDDPRQHWAEAWPETGGGVETRLQVFHDLHCLDYIRMYTYLWSYNEETLPRNFRNKTDTMIRTHVDHCIDGLRAALMCYSDVGPVLYSEIDVGEGKFFGEPDGSSLHRCRNFDKIRSWYHEHAAPY